MACIVWVTGPAQCNSSYIFAAFEDQPVPPTKAAVLALPRFSVPASPISCSPCSREANFTELLEILFLQALKMSSAWTERLREKQR